MRMVFRTRALIASLVATLASALCAHAGTHEASCVVRISGNDLQLPLSDVLMNEIVNSEPFVSRTLTATLGDSAARRDSEYTFAFESVDGGPTGARGSRGPILVGKVTVTIAEGGPPKAPELLGAVCSQLRDALIRLSESDISLEREQLQEQEARLHDLEARHADLMARAEELQARTSSGSLAGWSPDTTRKLGAEIDNLKRNLAANTARHEAIARQLAELGAKAADAAESDPLLAQLMRIVEYRHMQLDQTRKLAESGQVSEVAVAEAESHVAEARIALLHGQEEAKERATGGLTTDLKRKLIELSIENAEMEAQLEERSARLAQIREEGLDELGRLYDQNIQPELRQAESGLEVMRKEVERMRGRLAQVRPPRFDVIVGQ